MIETKPELEIGKEFVVSFYPIDRRVKAKYLGHKGGEIPYDTDFFVYEEDGKRTFILMRDELMIEREGIITYTPFSSVFVHKATERELKETSDNWPIKQVNSKLLNILRDLGEGI